jgi:hypothetical protein
MSGFRALIIGIAPASLILSACAAKANSPILLSPESGAAREDVSGGAAAQKGWVAFTGIAPGQASEFQSVTGVSDIEVRIAEAQLQDEASPDSMGARVEICNRSAEVATFSLSITNQPAALTHDIPKLLIQPDQCTSSGPLNTLTEGRALQPGEPIYVHLFRRA